MSRPTVDQESLKKIAYEHISYEIQMFTATIARLHKGELDQDEHNAILESFLIHARCLLDFLYQTEKPRKDDVVATDFFENPAELQSKLPPLPPVSSFLKQRTGKEIAHLTYGRLDITKEQKQWKIGDIHDQLAMAMAIFFECLPDHKVRWFSTVIRR